ncbi:hypothetical protein X946_5084 [Burkholderia sp. ABCPW 111]|nr:hypothetical protein X946_5084 [Burkholderia sp. ABCPW 111]
MRGRPNAASRFSSRRARGHAATQLARRIAGSRAAKRRALTAFLRVHNRYSAYLALAASSARISPLPQATP